MALVIRAQGDNASFIPRTGAFIAVNFFSLLLVSIWNFFSWRTHFSCWFLDAIGSWLFLIRSNLDNCLLSELWIIWMCMEWQLSGLGPPVFFIASINITKCDPALWTTPGEILFSLSWAYALYENGLVLLLQNQRERGGGGVGERERESYGMSISCPVLLEIFGICLTSWTLCPFPQDSYHDWFVGEGNCAWIV